MSYEKFYIKPEPPKVPLDQLLQLVRIVWDGDLISKGDRDSLVEMGFATRCEGFNIITRRGIKYLCQRGRLSN